VAAEGDIGVKRENISELVSYGTTMTESEVKEQPVDFQEENGHKS